jgi:hypothetical protein
MMPHAHIYSSAHDDGEQSRKQTNRCERNPQRRLQDGQLPAQEGIGKDFFSAHEHAQPPQERSTVALSAALRTSTFNIRQESSGLEALHRFQEGKKENRRPIAGRVWK